LAIFRANAGGFNNGARRTGFGPFEQRRPGFTLSRTPKARQLDFRPHGRSEVSTFERPANVRAFDEARSV
jgi:hypothetical protein